MKESDRIEKLSQAFDNKFNALKNRDSILKIQFEKNSRYTINDVIANLKQTLLKDETGHERLLDKKFNLNAYIFVSVQNIKKTIKRLEQTKIIGRVTVSGDSILNEENFKVGKFYPIRDLKRLEQLQIAYGKKTVHYTKHEVEEYDLNDEAEEDSENKGTKLNFQKETEDKIAEENKEIAIGKLQDKINELGDKCKNLLKEFCKRSDTNMKAWALEKNVKYENLKLDYFRCKEKLRQLYFQNSEKENIA